MNRVTFAALLLLSAGLIAQTPPTPEALLKAAQQRGQVDGDFAGALAQYQAIVDKHPKHPAAAQALLRIAEIHERQGDQRAAREALGRLVARFPSERAAAEDALARLKASDAGVTDRRLEWPGNARMAGDLAISPDGRYVSYTDQKTGELAVRDIRANRARQLTRMTKTGGFVEYSAISHDARTIAFVARDRQKPEGRRGLWLLPVNASESTPPRLLLEGEWYVPKGWSADDTQVLVEIVHDAGPSDIGFVNVRDASVRLLARPRHRGLGPIISMSPDGAFVAFDKRAGTESLERDVYLLPTNGGPEIPLLVGPSSEAVVGWSPDGSYLVFKSDREGSRGRGLWAQPVASGKAAGEPILLRAGFPGGEVGMSTRGALLYETRTSGAAETLLFTAEIDPETGALVGTPQIAGHDRNALHLAPRWSPDGKWFMYTTERPPDRFLSIRSEAGVVREVPRRLSYVWTFEVSPDARSIVYRATDLQGREGIFLMSTESGEIQTVALKQGPGSQPRGIGVYRPRFTADGSRLQYFRSDFETGVRQEIERNLATGEERVLAEVTTASRPSAGASPDGLFRVHLRGTPTSALYVEETATGAEREIFRVDRPEAFDSNLGIRWMPDGRTLLVKVAGTAPNERHLWLIPIDGRPPRQIDLGRTDIVDTGIAVHPDGRHIAYVAGDPIVSKTSNLQTEFRLLENFLPRAGSARR